MAKEPTGVVANDGGYLVTRRLLVAVVTIGAVVSLANGNWWLLVLALAAHALGTILVVTRAVQPISVIEHPSSTLAAMLDEQGIEKPDEHVSRLVEESARTATPETSEPAGERRR